MKYQSQAMKTNEANLRQRMKDMLAQCTPREVDVFQRMYDPHRKFSHPVDGIPVDHMDWAFHQIESTLAKKDQKSSSSG